MNSFFNWLLPSPTDFSLLHDLTLLHDPDPKFRDEIRSFTKDHRAACFGNADIVRGRSPSRWRYDATGMPVLHALTFCKGPLCYQHDHIVPWSKGGYTRPENCQILQSHANLLKSNKILSTDELQRFSIDLKLTKEQMDIIEMGVYGNIYMEHENDPDKTEKKKKNYKKKNEF